MSRNLPCRVTSSTSVPSSAESGGSKVFSALNAATCTLTMARSVSRPRRSRARASTSGSSGTAESRRPAVGPVGARRVWRSAAASAPSRRRCCPHSARPNPSRRAGGRQMAMPTARPLPETGSIFLDARGDDRALRVSWHPSPGLVVLSLWRENVCAGSFRLAVDEVPDLIEAAALRPRPGLRRRAPPAPSRPPRSTRHADPSPVARGRRPVAGRPGTLGAVDFVDTPIAKSRAG